MRKSFEDPPDQGRKLDQLLGTNMGSRQMDGSRFHRLEFRSDYVVKQTRGSTRESDLGRSSCALLKLPQASSTIYPKHGGCPLRGHSLGHVTRLS